MKKEFYNVKHLSFGLALFGLCLFMLGALTQVSVRDGVQDYKDVTYVITFIVAIIGMTVGQGYIMNAASYDVPQETGEGGQDE